MHDIKQSGFSMVLIYWNMHEANNSFPHITDNEVIISKMQDKVLETNDIINF